MSDELKKFPAPKSKDFELGSIDSVNHKPHPYCITPKHLGEHMYLDSNTIMDMEKNHGAHCGMYVGPDGRYTNGFKSGYSRCNVPYDEHTSDKVLFIQALVDKEVKDLKGLQSYTKSILPIMKKLKIDGIAFVAPEKQKK